MKNIKYLLMLVLACSLFTGCMDDDWDTPNAEALNKAYGNQEIAETNVITIGSLKEKYESVINASTNSYEQITEDVQIKGRVVATSTTKYLSTMAQVLYSSASLRVVCSLTFL